MASALLLDGIATLEYVRRAKACAMNAANFLKLFIQEQKLILHEKHYFEYVFITVSCIVIFVFASKAHENML